LLAALKRDGNKTNASEAIEDVTYYCPTCGEKLILKHGLIKIPHFAHHARSSCTWNNWEPESQRHLEMKSLVMANIKMSNKCAIAEYEYPIDNYIADVYFEIKGIKYAFECQCSNKSLKDFIEKTRAYTDLDVHTIWLFDFPNKWFVGKSRLEKEIKPSALMREAHRIHYGRIYTMYENKLVGVHFNPVFREYEVWDRDEYESGTHYDDCFYDEKRYVKTIKKPDVGFIPDWELKSTLNTKYSDENYRIGMFTEQKWWE